MAGEIRPFIYKEIDMSETMTITKDTLFDIISNMGEGKAPSMPAEAWYPPYDNLQKYVSFLFDGRQGNVIAEGHPALTVEDASDPDLVLSPEQAMYAISVHVAYRLRDEFKTINPGRNWKGTRTEEEMVYLRHLDNCLKWFMENSPEPFIIFWARTTLGIFRLTFDHTQMKNWVEFADKYQDLILSPA
jgi:hypothetical protein